ncbi:MAG: MBL fold metallo-hydrolase [Deferrisomatales bacterium]
MELTADLHGFFWNDPRANNCNTYWIDGEVPILIDPGHGAFLGRIEQELMALHRRVEDAGLVLVTHGHPDHLEGAALFARRPTRVAIHEVEAGFLDTLLDRFYRAQGGSAPEVRFDFFLREGELVVGDRRFQVLHTPGHSPGSACLYWPERKVLFTGDVLFHMGLGRTDLPGGNPAELKRSIERLEALEVEWMLSGHGEPVRGAEAFRRNVEGVRRAYFDYL